MRRAAIALSVLVLSGAAISLAAGVETLGPAADTGPRVRVNQLGYLPDGPKKATLVTDAAEPLAFEVIDTAGAVVFSGMSVPRGMDESAGVKVHSLDFSEVAAGGQGLVVSVDGDKSFPFDIDSALYATLPIDAASCFYPVRSGIEISADIAGVGYGRPAGHLGRPGDKRNQGDYGVPCQAAASSKAAYGKSWTCTYTLDVQGGWYDAGDQGKYVVNGGISVAQLMASWERHLATRASAAAAPNADGILGDGSLRVPEHGNGVPDILDEVRWELEWMLRMQVPAGEELAGMLHHKVHDDAWTGIPLLPSDDPRARELHRPSTAATLNLAAVAAQGSRLFRSIDETFADTLLKAAKTAWRAARANPKLFATPEDGNSGGGPYDDKDVSDEFYWAAVELYLATGDAGYRDALKASPWWKKDPFKAEGFDWGSVAGFARLQLARHSAVLAPEEAKAIDTSITDAGDRFLATSQSQPFGMAYAPGSGKYDWGSSHLVIQNALVLAAAYDLSGDRKYRQGALETMDYVLGRNALNMSYITGYGERHSHQQHSRWFAHSVNAAMPQPPKGSLAGGPNSSIQDPVAQALFASTGCASQTCYTDDIGSWSTNEITINWNAALTQFAVWLADQ